MPNPDNSHPKHSRQSIFKPVPSGIDLPQLDHQILELWDSRDSFQRSIDARSRDREYTFYDGPPFASGSPHYGNILAGIIKDIVPRYWTMRGFRVERRFGWDTHGLPVEMEAEKKLGISGPSQITEYGVDRFNEVCRSMVEATTEDWEIVTRRIGRWVDFVNDYKTMDTDFMESVWWVFRSLWDKGLIYRAFKVLPYSWGASTPLSNFEMNLGGYESMDDPSIFVRLEVTTGKGPVASGDFLLVWTTTPWTVPANLGVGVGPDIQYVAAEYEGSRYWVAESRLDSVWKENPPVAATASGNEFVGAQYRPAFGYFEEHRSLGAFQVMASAGVTTEEGTGLVHMAGAYGEEDFYTLTNAGVKVVVDPVDAEGRFGDQVPEVAGMNIKDADPVLIDLLSKSGALFRSGRITHQYPICYRTKTPLMYKAIPTWFVGVESFRDRMVANNEKVHWVPEHVGVRRFGNWLEDARDWAISRNRFWGSCIPVWICDRCEVQVCVGSRAELAELSGEMPDDLHKHVLDGIRWKCEACGKGTMVRVPEVLDCWFESGSMPYAQLHYPFENKERFDKVFPAQFIAEGLDQTRGWFYTLMVLGTALFDREPFENAVVNGMILAEDGHKMSKSLKNYPDPMELLETYGADSLRAYLITSPVLRGEPLRFEEAGVKQMVRSVVLPLWNSFSFFTTYANVDGITATDLDEAPPLVLRPELDRWIVSRLQSLISVVNAKMEGYYLYEVIPPILGFIDQLTNWYVRRSRRRFWLHRGKDDEDKMSAYATLHEVLVTFCRVLAPMLPFVTERIFQGLVSDPGLGDGVDSIHLTDFPQAQTDHIDQELETAVSHVREVVRLGQRLRKQEGVKVQQPLRSLTVASREPSIFAAIESHSAQISDELNVRELLLSDNETSLVEFSVAANFKELGPRLGPKVKEVAQKLSELSVSQIEELDRGGEIEVSGETITASEVVIRRQPISGLVVEAGTGMSVGLDTALDDELMLEGMMRAMVSKINQVRKDIGLMVDDRIDLTWWSENSDIGRVFSDLYQPLSAEILATSITQLPHQPDLPDRYQTIEVDGALVYLTITVSD